MRLIPIISALGYFALALSTGKGLTVPQSTKLYCLYCTLGYNQGMAILARTRSTKGHLSKNTNFAVLISQDHTYTDILLSQIFFGNFELIIFCIGPLEINDLKPD